jgi:uncharacterized protein with NRDE domain
MCLIFISINNHPTYKLIIAANRDEFYNRKTAAADFWSDHPHILGGRDLEARGTWMAMTKTGKVGMITNYRDPKNINPKAPSRGELVSNYLLEKIEAEPYLKSIAPVSNQYNGFNLIVGNINELWYFSNYRNGFEKLTHGLVGLSNHLLETPWPKVMRGKIKLQPILQEKEIRVADIFDTLYDTQQAEDNKLPATGLPVERERVLSSMFIKSPNYGSRCSTIMLVDQFNNVDYHERVYDLETFEHRTRSYRFNTNESLVV